MHEPLVSIIMPVYNAEKYLQKSLGSLTAQTYHTLEIICVDDGSSDTSAELLQTFSDSDNRIKVIAQANAGPAAARNNGLQYASGKYISFLDADDWLDSEAIQTAVDHAEAYSADLVFWSYKREYPNGTFNTYVAGETGLHWDESNIDKLYSRLIGLTGDQLKEPQKTDSLVTVWGKLYRSEVVKGIQFLSKDQIGATGEDLMFNIEAFAKLKCAVYLPDCFSHYRKDNQHSVTTSYKPDLVEKWNVQYEMITHKLDSCGKLSLLPALENRIALGIIGLGLSLVSDHSLSYSAQHKELKRIMKMPQYISALKQLDVHSMPIIWKTFFLAAKMHCIIALQFLLCLMNSLRNH